MSKPWEHVKTVNVAATTSFLIPLIPLDFAILLKLQSKSKTTFDHLSTRTRRREREMEQQSVPLGLLLGLLCLLKAY